MKYVVLAGALAFTLCAGVCEAEDSKSKTAGQAPAVEAAGSRKGLTHIDFGDDSEKPVDSVGVMSEGQNYDGNTGFPNIVKSDSDMNLE